jgi:hypothetical protein
MQDNATLSVGDVLGSGFRANLSVGNWTTIGTALLCLFASLCAQWPSICCGTTVANVWG